jgi:ATP-dependent Clp protease protease subunit
MNAIPMINLQQQPQPAKPWSLTFVGPIQNPASKNLRNACCNALNQGTKELQILFSSIGGAVDEGLALYNFLRALPLKLTMHAIGRVDSMGLPVFLAGEQRFCSPETTFLFHDVGWGSPGAIAQSRSQWAALHLSLDRDILRIQELLKLRTTFTQEDFERLQLYDKTTIQDARFAKEKGIVHEIKQPCILAGSFFGNIEF